MIFLREKKIWRHTESAVKLSFLIIIKKFRGQVTVLSTYG